MASLHNKLNRVYSLNYRSIITYKRPKADIIVVLIIPSLYESRLQPDHKRH